MLAQTETSSIRGWSSSKSDNDREIQLLARCFGVNPRQHQGKSHRWQQLEVPLLSNKPECGK